MTKIKVKMLTSIAGNANPVYDLPDHGYQFGQVVELHPDLAALWIASGKAEAVEEEQLPVKTKLEEPPAAPPAAKVVPIASVDKVAVEGVERHRRGGSCAFAQTGSAGSGKTRGKAGAKGPPIERQSGRGRRSQELTAKS